MPTKFLKDTKMNDLKEAETVNVVKEPKEGTKQARKGQSDVKRSNYTPKCKAPVKRSKNSQKQRTAFRTQLTKKNICRLIGKKIEFFAPSDNGGEPIQGKTIIRAVSTDPTAPIQEATSIAGYDICRAFYVDTDTLLHIGDKGKNVTYRINTTTLPPVDTYALHILKKYDITFAAIAQAAGVSRSFVFKYFRGVYKITTLKRRKPKIYRCMLDYVNSKIDVKSDQIQDSNFNREGLQYGRV